MGHPGFFCKVQNGLVCEDGIGETSNDEIQGFFAPLRMTA
jgi:hypothetical protein